jgi:hypothetical protein
MDDGFVDVPISEDWLDVQGELDSQREALGIDVAVKEHQNSNLPIHPVVLEAYELVDRGGWQPQISIILVLSRASFNMVRTPLDMESRSLLDGVALVRDNMMLDGCIASSWCYLAYVNFF